MGETLEGILKLFDNNASGIKERISDSDDENEDLSKKIGELSENVKDLRREIVELKAGQKAAEVQLS